MPKKVSSDDRTLIILAHILGVVVSFWGALIIMLISENEEVKKHAKYALNWQISLVIYFIISLILVFLLIGIPALLILGVLNLIFCILGAIKASNGELWKYPLSIQFFKVK